MVSINTTLKILTWLKNQRWGNNAEQISVTNITFFQGIIFMFSKFSDAQKDPEVVFGWSIEVYVVRFVILTKRFACTKKPITVWTYKVFLCNCHLRWKICKYIVNFNLTSR
jgi:hypothetical protein